jgi:hypothetical protein
VIEPVDVLFELIYRRPGEEDVVFGSWQTHWEPLGNDEYTAQPWEESVEADAFDFQEGDQLVFRYTGTGTDDEMAYIPNGEGPEFNGRFPYVELPQD